MTDNLGRQFSVLFRQMLREEYRLHAELFGPGRFLAFPVVLSLFAAGGFWLLSLSGTAIETIIAGLFVLVFLFGLQVGTIGLVGRDALRDVLGDVTLLVFSARTLPVSRRRLLAVFICKDIVYYLLFFLTPVVVGFAPVGIQEGMSVPSLFPFWLAIGATFALGSATSLALIGVANRSRIVVTVIVTVIAAGLWADPEIIVSLTPYAAFIAPTVQTVAVSSIVLMGAVFVGLTLFQPTADTRVRRRDPHWYRRLSTRIGPSAARSLLTVARSSGSVWKVAFSLGLLFAVVALLLDRVTAATTLRPAAGVAFGTLLGLGTFTTYNWVTQSIDGEEYLRYPTGLTSAFQGIFRAFFTLSIPLGVGYLALAAVLYPVVDLLVGLLVFPLVSLYVFGVTAYLTGFSPNELLFDTLLFSLYGLALAVVAVPLLVAALTVNAFPVGGYATIVVVSAGSGGVGVWLTLRAPERWERIIRMEGK